MEESGGAAHAQNREGKVSILLPDWFKLLEEGGCLLGFLPEEEGREVSIPCSRPTYNYARRREGVAAGENRRRSVCWYVEGALEELFPR